MWSCLSLVALAAAPAPVKLGTAPFAHVGLAAETASLLQDTLVNRLSSRPGFEVVTPADIAATLGLERQRALLGCADDGTSCAVELAGALGVDGLITGSVGRVGQSFVLNVKVVSARDARPLFVHASKALATEGLLLEEAVTVADLIAAQLTPASPGGARESPAWPPWLLVGGGALVAGGGVVFAALASTRLDVLDGRAQLPIGTTPEAVRDQGKLFQGLGIGLIAGGGAMILGGILWKAAAPRAPVSAQLAVGREGAFASVRVELK